MYNTYTSLRSIHIEAVGRNQIDEKKHLLIEASTTRKCFMP